MTNRALGTNDKLVLAQLANRFRDATTRRLGTDENTVYEIVAALTLAERAGYEGIKDQFEAVVAEKYDIEKGPNSAAGLVGKYKESKFYKERMCQVVKHPSSLNLQRVECKEANIVFAIAYDEMSDCAMEPVRANYSDTPTLFMSCGVRVFQNEFRTRWDAQQKAQADMSLQSFLLENYPALFE